MKAALMFTLTISTLLAAACASALREVNDSRDDAALARCRAEGRAARAADASPEDAYAAYVRCTRDAGLR